MALCEINSYLEQNGKALVDYQFPNFASSFTTISDTFDCVNEAQKAIELRSLLNSEQLAVADTVLARVLKPIDSHCEANVFYLDGPGGSGKTFTYNYLVHELQGHNMHVATAQWISIAPTLLLGRTVHSMFKLPNPLLETSTCNVTPASKLADMLRAQSLFIIDE